MIHFLFIKLDMLIKSQVTLIAQKIKNIAYYSSVPILLFADKKHTN